MLVSVPECVFGRFVHSLFMCCALFWSLLFRVIFVSIALLSWPFVSLFLLLPFIIETFFKGVHLARNFCSVDRSRSPDRVYTLGKRTTREVNQIFHLRPHFTYQYIIYVLFLCVWVSVVSSLLFFIIQFLCVHSVRVARSSIMFGSLFCCCSFFAHISALQII